MSDELSWYPEGDWSHESGMNRDRERTRSSDNAISSSGMPGSPRSPGSLQWPISHIRHATPSSSRKYDSIILTQSCDLENEKVGDILLAQLICVAFV